MFMFHHWVEAFPSHRTIAFAMGKILKKKNPSPYGIFLLSITAIEGPILLAKLFSPSVIFNLFFNIFTAGLMQLN